MLIAKGAGGTFKQTHINTSASEDAAPGATAAIAMFYRKARTRGLPGGAIWSGALLQHEGRRLSVLGRKPDHPDRSHSSVG